MHFNCTDAYRKLVIPKVPSFYGLLLCGIDQCSTGHRSLLVAHMVVQASDHGRLHRELFSTWSCQADAFQRQGDGGLEFPWKDLDPRTELDEQNPL
jgi:hypothetical protein